MEKRQFIQRIAVASLLPWLTPASATSKPDLLLAQKAPPQLDPSRYLVSEKLDGVRAFWDGGKMFTRHGQPINLPAWFAAHLPLQALDGELWMARGQFEAASAAVRRFKPEPSEWQQLHYMLFELPGASGSFEQRATSLQAIANAAAFAQLQALPQTRVGSSAELNQRLTQVLQLGGEGLVLHLADAPYQTGRKPALLKLKPEDDDEAVVLAHLPGEGRFAGMLGALRVRNAQGLVFQLGTGFSDAQRRTPPSVGTTVTYRYRGLTDKGLPRFASFLRVQDL